MKHSDKIQAVSDYLNNRRNFLKGTLLFSAGALLNSKFERKSCSTYRRYFATCANRWHRKEQGLFYCR